MSIIYLILSILVLGGVAALTWRSEKLQGEDHEPDELAVGKNVVIAIIIEIVLWQVISIIARLNVEYWWYQNLGYTQVWYTNTVMEWTLRIGAFIITYLVLSAGQLTAETSVPRVPPPKKDTPKKRYAYGETAAYEQLPVITRYYKVAARLLKVLIAWTFAAYAAIFTDDILLLTHQVSWGRLDPIFRLDYGFYAITLPFLHSLVLWTALLTILSACFTAGVYLYLHWRNDLFQTYFEDFESAVERFWSGVTGQSLLYVMIMYIFVTINTVLKKHDLIVDGTSRYVSGAGFIDVTARIPALNFMVWVYALVAIVMLVLIFIPKKWQFGMWSGVASVVLAIVALTIVPYFKGLQYNTNPLNYELRYLEYQLESTKYAFGLDKFKVPEEPANYVNSLTSDELRASSATFDQTRIVDWEPMLSANDTLNEYVPVYDFWDVDIDRYNGTEVMLAIRELNSDQIPGEQNWVNKHFRYTHGFGHTVASISEIDSRGEPQWIVRNIPPTGPAEYMVEHPEIYFGELTTEYVFVNGSLKEFGSPQGNSLQETAYEGPAGIPVGGSWRRFVLAVYMNDYRVMFSSLLDADTRIIFDRTSDQRKERLIPFVGCDDDPYGVLGGTEIVNMRDCFTRNGSIPYSETFGGVNYARGSVKMTMGSWSGETNFYVVDPSDPLIQSWMLVYPGLFKPMSEMPENLQQHIRYPDDLLAVQADAWSRYHVTKPEALFNRQDQWERAKESGAIEEQATSADPRYVMMTVPGVSNTPEFVSTVYFTPVGKQSLVGGLIVRNDPMVYGEIHVFDFPRDQTVVGPQMVEARISQHEDLSPKITLWNQQGSTVVWGQIIGLVIPTNDGVGVVYVRSLYLQSQEAQIPSIKLVIISQGENLVYAPSLPQALELLYSGQVLTVLEDATSTPTGSRDELIQQALDHFNNAQTCAADGNWVCFGTEMQALQKVLEALQK